MPQTEILLFNQQTTAPEHDYPNPERLVSGNPKRTTWNHYTNQNGTVNSGVWSCEQGSWRIQMAEQECEYFYVLIGSGTLISDNGTQHNFRAGDAVIIPEGFSGIFQVNEALTKHYVIIDPTQ